MKLSGDGVPQWSTYLGGDRRDWGKDVCIDQEGNIYVTGETYSDNWITGGYDTEPGPGSLDTFLVKLSPDGEFEWSTYLSEDLTNHRIGQVEVDRENNVYVVGSISPPTPLFPVQGIITKLSPDGGCIWTKIIGEGKKQHSQIYGIAFDLTNHFYVVGMTVTAGWVEGGFDTSFSGITDGVIMKLTNDGEPVWASYIGGDYSDECNTCAVDASGRV
jgi:hypothetical protein